MRYIHIRNWEEYQHYKNRDPVWIKLYHRLLDDYEYGCLQDASKLLLFSLYMLAARTGNKIPADLDWIKSKAMIKGKVNLEELEATGFISYSGDVPSCYQDASKSLATCYAREEKRRDRVEIEKKTLSSQLPDENSREFQFASLLFSLILENDPKAKKPNLQKWAKDIDGIIRLDGRDPPQVEEVIKWCQQDPFWKANILSAAKLRKKFPQLLHKMNGGNGHGKPKQERFDEKRYEGSDLSKIPWNRDKTGGV